MELQTSRKDPADFPCGALIVPLCRANKGEGAVKLPRIIQALDRALGGGHR